MAKRARADKATLPERASQASAVPHRNHWPQPVGPVEWVVGPGGGRWSPRLRRGPVTGGRSLRPSSGPVRPEGIDLVSEDTRSPRGLAIDSRQHDDVSGGDVASDFFASSPSSWARQLPACVGRPSAIARDVEAAMRVLRGAGLVGPGRATSLRACRTCWGREALWNCVRHLVRRDGDSGPDTSDSVETESPQRRSPIHI